MAYTPEKGTVQGDLEGLARYLDNTRELPSIVAADDKTEIGNAKCSP